MKYKIGDTITIRKDLKESQKLGDQFITRAMLDYRGKKAKIVDTYGFSGIYSLDIDKKFWNWNDEMFEEENKYKKAKATIVYNQVAKEIVEKYVEQAKEIAERQGLSTSGSIALIAKMIQIETNGREK